MFYIFYFWEHTQRLISLKLSSLLKFNDIWPCNPRALGPKINMLLQIPFMWVFCWISVSGLGRDSLLHRRMHAHIEPITISPLFYFWKSVGIITMLLHKGKLFHNCAPWYPLSICNLYTLQLSRGCNCVLADYITQLMHSFKVNIRICQPENSETSLSRVD